MAATSQDKTADGNLRASVFQFGDQDLFCKEFVVGWNELSLTQEEKRARTEWNRARSDHVDVSNDDMGWKCWSQEELLRNSVLPPMFAADKASVRSGNSEPRSKRYYPPQVVPWEEFESFCSSEPFSTSRVAKALPSSEFFSHQYTTVMGNETDEHQFLKGCVFEKLQKGGLLTGRLELDTGLSRGVVYIGRPDDVGVRVDDAGSVVSSIIEVKSTQNMLIPNDVTEICDRYKQAFDHQETTRSKDRSLDCSRIGHPLAQMLGYMIDNEVPHGALCSASKTYFVRLVKTANQDESRLESGATAVEITRAWKTCEANYLRAWAVFSRLSNRRSDSLSGTNPLDEVRKNGWALCTPFHKPRTRSAAAAGMPKDDGDYDSDGDQGDDNTSMGKGGHKTAPKGRSWIPKALKRGRKGSSQGTGGGKKVKDNKDSGNAKSAEAGNRKANSVGAPEHACLPPPPLERNQTPNALAFDFEQSLAPFVTYDALRNKTFIAESRNGVVFSAEVAIDGEQGVYAVKQFDLSKNYEGYKQELEAYKHLQRAWGEVVPRPHFLSASPTGNVRFLGMTMGDVPMGPVSRKEVEALQTKLIHDYSFRHLDNSHGQNYITVKGKLMMIDFEQWENLEIKNENE